MTRHFPVVVVGGGISGLVCAYALRKAGIEVLLLESSARTGGMVRSERRNDFLIELGPQSFSGTREIRTLVSELGIASQVVQAPSAAPRFVLVNGKLQPVPLSPPALLSSSLLGLGTKLSLGRDAVGRSTPPEDDESIANFVRRKFTAELLDKLVGPFVSGIYAGDPERLSLRSAFPQVYEAERSAGSVIRGLKRAARDGGEPRERPILLNFRNGTEALIDALNDRLGSAVRTATEAISLARSASKNSFEVRVRTSGSEETISARAVVLSTPTAVAGVLLNAVAAELGQLLGGIEYASIAVVSLVYRRSDVAHSLQGFGFLVPRSSGLRILGTVWNSSLFAGRAPADHVLLTSFIGGATDPGAAALSLSDLVSTVHAELAPLLKMSQSPVFYHVTTNPAALPQYNLGHSHLLARIEKLRQSAVPSLWLAGNYLRGPSIGACIEQALAVAEDVCSRLAR